MRFSEGMKVSYDNFDGSISFVGDNYIVIEIDGSTNQNPARLLIYRHNYKYVIVTK